MQAKTANSLFGIDISSFQGDINWNLVATNIPRISFIYHRVIRSNGVLDEKFLQNVIGARSVGIPIGGYHFANPQNTSIDPIEEADNFIAGLQQGFGNGKFGDIYPVLDLEFPITRNDSIMNPTELLEWADTFRQYFETKTGRLLMLYTGNYFIDLYNNFNYPTPGNPLVSMPLWVANYSVTQPPDGGGWTSWKVWQYSDNGNIKGISIPSIGENVGIGDGVTREFMLDGYNVVRYSEAIYLDGIQTTDYSIPFDDYDIGGLTKVTFNTPPVTGVVITADYTYNKVDVNHGPNTINELIDRKEAKPMEIIGPLALSGLVGLGLGYLLGRISRR